MRNAPLPDVTSRFGAPMGRPGNPRGTAPTTPKVTLQRIRLNSGGYDRGGAYWGIGAPLYWAAAEDGTYEDWFRAGSREAAKARVRTALPGARFYR